MEPPSSHRAVRPSRAWKLELGLAGLVIGHRGAAELELLSTVLFTAPLSGTTAKIVRGDGPLTEIVDIYLVEAPRA